ncbi:transcription termination factor 4, mitochondrial [Aulostomus maculatus]
MSSTAAAYQILRWTVRNGSFSVFGPPRLVRCLLQPKCLQRKWLCSSSNQNNLLPSQPSQEPSSLLLLPRIKELGFTDTQAEQIYEYVNKARTGRAVERCVPTLTTLLVLGLSPSRMMNVLKKCPEIFTIQESLIQQRLSNLRKLGLVEGSLQRVVVHYPIILTVPVKTIKTTVMFLREKCLFTVQQVIDILQDTPAIVLEDHRELEYKFQYVYFRMGIKQAQIVKSRLFRVSLAELRCRHSFLERRGLFQTPDKKGQTFIINPSLNSLINAGQDTFLRDVAMASAEEYDVFQRLIARECREDDQQQQYSDSDVESDDDDDDDDDEESRRKGYYKKGKK